MAGCSTLRISLPNHVASPPGAIVRGGKQCIGSKSSSLRKLCGENKLSLALTYLLFNVENGAQLAQPWLLGLTISAALGGRTWMLWVFAGFFCARMVIGVSRRMYDTRAFARIYATLVTQVVVSQRQNRIEVSRVAARAGLAREFTDFFERDVPEMIRSAYSVIGGLVMLGWFDPLLAAAAMITGCGGGVLNLACARRARQLNRQVNDVLEDEVRVVSCGRFETAATHYARLTKSQVRASDWHAVNFSATQVFVLCLLIAALYRIPTWSTESVGGIYAVLRYVTMFNTGIAGLPLIVQRLARLADIRRRFGGGKAD